MSMDALLNALGKDRRMIAYRPEWRPMLGSVNSVILLGQLLYWWKNNNSKPFYKFKAPCKHTKYREGDSWCEELGFSKAEFDKAWKQIEEAGFASKKINLERVTVFTINEEDLGKALLLIYGDNPLNDGETLGKSTKWTYESQESDPGTSGNSTHVNQQSAFTLYKEQRLPTEITAENTLPSNLPSAEPCEVVTGQANGSGEEVFQKGKITLPNLSQDKAEVEIDWPEFMTDVERTSAVRLLADVEPEQIGQVLAVWSWKVTQEKVNSRIGIFGYLCHQAKAGMLDHSLAAKWRGAQNQKLPQSGGLESTTNQEKLRILDAELRGALQLVEASDTAEWSVKSLESLKTQWQGLTGSQWQLA